MTDKEMVSALKLLIATLNDTLWDEGHPGYSDSEPGYLCPECSCKNCYRVSCDFNESELFKKLHKELTEAEEGKKKFEIEQLTEAKEIIKDLLDTQYQLDPYLDVFKARIKRAEDFLAASEAISEKEKYGR